MASTDDLARTVKLADDIARDMRATEHWANLFQTELHSLSWHQQGRKLLPSMMGDDIGYQAEHNLKKTLIETWLHFLPVRCVGP